MVQYAGHHEAADRVVWQEDLLLGIALVLQTLAWWVWPPRRLTRRLN